jgi:hypothetical protein
MTVTPHEEVLPTAIQFETVAHERISNDAILLPSSSKMK